MDHWRSVNVRACGEAVERRERRINVAAASVAARTTGDYGWGAVLAM